MATGGLHFNSNPFISGKGGQIAGIGVDNLRLIEVDENFAMRPDALAAPNRRGPPGRPDSVFCLRDRGTTSSNAIDPVPEIGRICRRIICGCT